MRVKYKLVNLRILTLGLVVNSWITSIYPFNTQQPQMGQEHSNQKSNATYA